MSTREHVLASPPKSGRDLELWLQHGVGFILFEDVRRYALKQIDPSLDDAVQAAARKAIDDALYGLMMVLDGVTGALQSTEHRLDLQVLARLTTRSPDGTDRVAKLDLAEGDGLCMGYHGWLEGDFGSDPIIEEQERG
jgi:hypothetical protein